MIRRTTLTLVLLGLLSCGGNEPTQPDPPALKSLTLSADSVSLSYLGASAFLAVTPLDQFARPIAAQITWASDNPAVATAVGSGTTSGQVTAVGNGVATISATSGTVTASATVVVEQVASIITIVSGDQQSATVAQTLEFPLVIRSDDQGGSPVPGTAVTFATSTEGAALTVTEAVTDGNALASTEWTLGTVAGLQSVTAQVVGGGPTAASTLRATAEPGAPVALDRLSGDGQTSSVGWPLDEPVVVNAVDEFGNGVGGLTVHFAPASGGGAVSSADVDADEDGSAQTIWTMGPDLGTQTLNASVPGLDPVVFTATAETPKPDLTTGEITLSPEFPTALQSFDVSAPITNVGHFTTGSGFQAQILVDGTPAGTVDIDPLDIDATQVATFTVGPLAPGLRSLEIVADAGAAIDEREEGNNGAGATSTIPVTTLLTAGTAVSGLGASEGTEYLYTLEVGPDEPGTMIVELSGGVGDVDLYVHYGNRPGHRDDYECQSGNPDTTERCVFNAAEPGTYHVLLYAWASYEGTTMLATTGGPVIPFDVDVRFIGSPTTSQREAFEAAADRWMDILPGDISDFTGYVGNPLGADLCMDGQPAINEVVDDVIIYVAIDSIDGVGGTLARAGPCTVRGLGWLPIVGIMEFDEADLAFLQSDGGLASVVMHEMAHVLGLGTIWDLEGMDLVHDPSLELGAGADTYFSGPRAIAAFDEAGGGTTYTLGRKVPVANLADPGSADAHWRESVLGEELMTPGYNAGVLNPLSAITIASMKDIGYTIDLSQADPFTKVYRAPAQPSQNRPVLDLSGDVRQGPIWIQDKEGGLREAVRRRRTVR